MVNKRWKKGIVVGREKEFCIFYFNIHVWEGYSVGVTSSNKKINKEVQD
jgi:hypothetical protein